MRNSTELGIAIRVVFCDFVFEFILLFDSPTDEGCDSTLLRMIKKINSTVIVELRLFSVNYRLCVAKSIEYGMLELNFKEIFVRNERRDSGNVSIPGTKRCHDDYRY